jgi:spermidine synthase
VSDANPGAHTVSRPDPGRPGTGAGFSGRHVLAELDGIDPALLDDPALLAATLRSAVSQAGAKVFDVVSHRFEPHGVTVLALLAESHASVHTYPEFGTMFADVFTCGDQADPELAIRLLATALDAGAARLSVVDRGEGAAVAEPVGAGLSRRWAVSEVLFHTHTGFQDLLIGRTAQGIALFCDNERQSTEATQLTYHEALMVPAMLLARHMRRVLIIGSSEGVASRLAAAEGAEVDHVDIDRVAVRACAEHLPYGYTPEALAVAERGRGPIRVHYRDGWDFVTESGGGYDVVVIDLPDENAATPQAQHNRLYGEDFLRRCAGLLNPGGVLTSQAGCPTMWRNDTLISAWRRFGAVFETVVYYGSDEHEWAFLCGRPDPVADPVGTMTGKLAKASYRPETIDAQALRGNSTPPLSVRAGAG